MDYLLVLIIGILIGWLMTWFWFIIRGRWRERKNLRGAYDKTIKEIADKSKKARDDKRKSRDVAVRAFVESALYGLVIVVLVLSAAALVKYLFFGSKGDRR